VPLSFDSSAEKSAINDVLVIGGGPAGSTIAALLAQRGKSVILLDKDRHPRFHIGESLLPFSLPLLDRLGVREAVERIGMPKYGIEFVSPDHDRSSLLEFGEGWHKDMDYSYQVRRSEFDHILIENAQARGAEVHQGVRVEDVEFPPEGGVVASATADDGTRRRWQARFLVDATGRDTFLASKLGLKQRNRRHESAAIYGHFSGAERLKGREEGNISIFWFAGGWFWLIPLADGTTSIGAVCRPEKIKNRNGDDVTTFFHKLISSCPALADRLRHATLIGDAIATGNYSYQSQSMVGERYIMVGDSSSFIDPVFSTGVHLAMSSAFKGADAVVTCLDQPALAKQALKRFEQEVRQGLDRFSWFIYRITSPAIRSLFMGPRNVLRMKEAVLSLLAGDTASNSPIRFRLILFKGLYYAKTLMGKIRGQPGRPPSPSLTPPAR
jgi:flavin-dependent dehydrogenase